VIALALLTFAPGAMGGSEEVVRTLTASLAEYGTREYRVLAPPDAVDVADGLPAEPAGARGSSARLVALSRALTSGDALRGAGVVHYPFTIPAPRPRRPHVVTLHDVLHLDLPELVPQSVRAFRLWAYDRAARKADRVVVPSAFVRNRAVARLGLDPARVRVIPHAVDTAVFHPPSDDEREPFVLYPARPWPHKNHALLFEAFAEVRRERPDLELVLTGGGHERLRLPAGVRSLGLVPRADLAELYRRASALVFPSRYEGFGLPVLEAMASGLPVAAAAGGAVEEVAGGAVRTFSPGSASQAASAIVETIENGASKTQQALEVARTFTRERVARLHDEVYAELEG
jgi:glycosyltransferase involved in cell wall biosynthesis